MTESRLRALYEKCVNDKADAEERQEFLYLMSLPENQEIAAKLVRLSLDIKSPDNELNEESADHIFQSIIETDKPKEGILPNISHRTYWLKPAFVRYAAAIVLIAGAVLYFLKTPTSKPIVAKTDVAPSYDINPGTDKAILTLSDGRKVQLSESGTQKIQDGTLSIENKDGKLQYEKGNYFATNTMSTPKGAQYKLTLVDGTNVWLNAASSITYPTAFPGNSREVSVTGEVYFEVAENKAKPFIVKTYSDVITVVGTVFNVNAYHDESATKTSLLKGAVKINNQLLKPGQAFQNDRIIQTDITRDIAWKNGVFNFESATTQQLMRQLSRWYDIDIIYEGSIPQKKFHGKLGRDLKLSQILEVLHQFNIRYTLEGRKLAIKSNQNF